VEKVSRYTENEHQVVTNYTKKLNFLPHLISFLEIALCHKVPIQSASVKIDIDVLSDKKKKSKIIFCLTFMKEKKCF